MASLAVPIRFDLCRSPFAPLPDGPRFAARTAACACPQRFAHVTPTVWVRGPAGLSAERLYARTVAAGVAFVPGKFFYVNQEDGEATFRMNFTAADPATIDRAVAVLADAIAEELAVAAR